MKIASITVTMNDWHSVHQWTEYYNQYKNYIYKHIIVDNGSSKEYLKLLKELFPGSIIIERVENGGTTRAYNDGIKLALSDVLVDSIFLIANDIKLEDDLITVLHKKLFENETVGMIAPIMLLKDSNNIESYGMMMKTKVSLDNIYNKKSLTNDLPIEMIVDMVPGGMHLSKRELYEKVGLQDDSLFMYSDEVDWAIRMKKNNYKVLITRSVLCWHQHINSDGKKKGRNKLVFFLQARNKLLLAYKHYNFLVVLETLFKVNVMKTPYTIRRSVLNVNPNLFIYYLIGTFYGFFNIKKIIRLRKN